MAARFPRASSMRSSAATVGDLSRVSGDHRHADPELVNALDRLTRLEADSASSAMAALPPDDRLANWRAFHAKRHFSSGKGAASLTNVRGAQPAGTQRHGIHSPNDPPHCQ